MHKTVNVLDKFPLSVLATMKKDLREVYWAPNRAPAEAAIEVLPRNTAPNTVGRSNVWSKDRAALLAFYDFPAEHWDHLRTRACSPPCGTGRCAPRDSLSPASAKLMVFRLVIAASKTWRRLKGTNQLPKVIVGVRVNAGIEVIQVPANHAA